MFNKFITQDLTYHETLFMLKFQMANVASWAPTLAFVMGVVYMLGGLAKFLRQMGLVPMYVSTVKWLLPFLMLCHKGGTIKSGRGTKI